MFCEWRKTEQMKYVVCYSQFIFTAIRKNVLSNYTYLVSEIEPTRLRQKLIRERVFKAPEFDEILKVSTQRRGRVVWFLRKLLQKEPTCLLAFIDALKIANYLDIAEKLIDISGTA